MPLAFWRRENLWPLPEMEHKIRGRSARSLIAVPTERCFSNRRKERYILI
jgi:hypothetical protein